MKVILIVVIAIIVITAVFMTLMIPRITPGEAKRKQVQADSASLREALELFKDDNMFYPTNEQGLEALVVKPTTGCPPTRWREGGYFKLRIPLDPWGNPYVYFSPGRCGEPYEIISRVSAGQESEDDISSSSKMRVGGVCRPDTPEQK